MSQPGGESIDTVVLACTHFPLLQDELVSAFGGKVRFIDGAQGIARRIAFLTQGQLFERQEADFAVVTGAGHADEKLHEALRPYGLAQVHPL